MHREAFAPATPPKAPAPRAPDRRGLRREERRRALKGISWLAFAERKAAKASADERAEERALALEGEAELERQRVQAALDAAWQALLANNPDAVLSVLEAAFEDNEAPAAAIDCDGQAVSVVMRMPARDAFVPDRQADATPTGRPTVKRISKTLRNQMHAGAVMSHALVTAKEAFAVAPGIDAVMLLAVMDDEVSVQPIYAGAFTRDGFDSVDWSEGASTISARLGGWMKVKGQAAELACLPLGDEPELLQVVERIAEVVGLPVAKDAYKTA
ncbi:MAG: hypothetical protein WD399_04595 [Thermoleophilaceae bacterium]